MIQLNIGSLATVAGGLIMAGAGLFAQASKIHVVDSDDDVENVATLEVAVSGLLLAIAGLAKNYFDDRRDARHIELEKYRIAQAAQQSQSFTAIPTPYLKPPDVTPRPESSAPERPGDPAPGPQTT